VNKDDVAKSGSQRGAFTLIELLIVVAIIAVLAVMILTGLETAQGRARQVRCMSNLRQIDSAIHMYAYGNNGGFLPRFDNGIWIGAVGTTSGILPVGRRIINGVEYQFSVYGFMSFPGGSAFFIPPREGDVFLCPSDTKAIYSTSQGVKCSYVGLSIRNYAHMDGITNPQKRLLLIEAHQNAYLQATLPGVTLYYEHGTNPRIMERRHSGCANILFCDHHIETLDGYKGGDKALIENYFLSMGDSITNSLDIRYWENDFIPPTSTTTSTTSTSSVGGGGGGSSSMSTTTVSTSIAITTSQSTTSSIIYIGP